MTRAVKSAAPVAKVLPAPCDGGKTARLSERRPPTQARVAELAYAADSKSAEVNPHAGSTPASGTRHRQLPVVVLQTEPAGHAALLAQPQSPDDVHRRFAPQFVDAVHRHWPVVRLHTLPVEQSDAVRHGAVHWSVTALQRNAPQMSDGFVEHAGVHTASVVKNWQVYPARQLLRVKHRWRQNVSLPDDTHTPLAPQSLSSAQGP